ncbi:MAG TPA: PEGA domain-containing protein, partial [Kofleriaceae bacterium]|nr:PEGA domain-containing protein [Kofleriaceae bacterium]
SALAGPRTARIERGAAPAGKRRARTETFATNVALKSMLERATPLFPLPALRDELAGAGAAAPGPGDGGEPAARPATAPAPTTAVAPRRASDPDAVIDRPEPPPLAMPGRTPPSRGLLILLALGTLALGGAAVNAFLRGRGRHADPAPSLGPSDAPPAPLDAPEAAALSEAGPPADAALSAASDAARPGPGSGPGSGPGPGPGSGPAPGDAGPRVPRAGSGGPATPGGSGGGPATPAPDAGLRLPDPGRPTGEATLVIGANPWGDIYIDGTRKGRTPTTIVVPAGKHAIEVVFGGEDPPRTKRFAIDLRAGETQQLDADFTKP